MKLKPILSNSYVQLTYVVVLMLCKIYVTIGNSPLDNAVILLAWKVIQILLLAAIAHVILILIMATFIGNPEKEWWERRKPSMGMQILSFLTGAINISAPIILYVGILWVIAVCSLKSLLLGLVFFIISLGINKLKRLLKKKSSYQH